VFVEKEITFIRSKINILTPTPTITASQVTNILHKLTATSMPINKADYVYNPVGNRTSLTDRRGNQAFGYDQLDRLTSASHPLLEVSLSNEVLCALFIEIRPSWDRLRFLT
jgi:YD repeat-containing protein